MFVYIYIYIYIYIHTYIYIYICVLYISNLCLAAKCWQSKLMRYNTYRGCTKNLERSKNRATYKDIVLYEPVLAKLEHSTLLSLPFCKAGDALFIT